MKIPNKRCGVAPVFSLISDVNSADPNPEPCGTPLVTFVVLEVEHGLPTLVVSRPLWKFEFLEQLLSSFRAILLSV